MRNRQEAKHGGGMAGVKIGVALHPQQTTADDYLRAWQRADALGVDVIWNWDHFFPLSGDPHGPNFEGWTVLAVCGSQTRRARIGCLVLAMSYRNPALLSAMARTLDQFVGGRLILGLGAGWFERDYDEYGYAFGTARERLGDLERGIEVIKERWAVDAPKPVRGTIPILIGGGGEKVTLRIAARHADLWHGFGSPAEWGRKNRILDEWCAQVGRSPEAIARCTFIADEFSQAPIADMRRYHDTLEAYVAAGADQIFYGLGAPFDLAPIEGLLRWRDERGAGG
jgi:probable F420-dependent oxidoreductase